MIKKYIACGFLFFIFSCSNIEFVMKNSSETNPLKDKTILLMDKNSDEGFVVFGPILKVESTIAELDGGK